MQEKKGGTGAGVPVVDPGALDFEVGGIVVGVSLFEGGRRTVRPVTGTDGPGGQKSGCNEAETGFLTRIIQEAVLCSLVVVILVGIAVVRGIRRSGFGRGGFLRGFFGCVIVRLPFGLRGFFVVGSLRIRTVLG